MDSKTVVKLAKSLKIKYKDKLLYQEEQWPPCQSNKLGRLELVEEKKVEYNTPGRNKDLRIPLAYDEILKVKSENETTTCRRVLVNGGAGIGKSTLCTAISQDWANDKLFQQFHLLLLLPLRHRAISSAQSIHEVIQYFHKNKDICDAVVSYLEEEEGNNVLIVADGWDELGERERKEGSFFYNLLLNTFPFASVIITSRPSASAHLRKYMKRFIEIVGFGKESIEKFIQAELSDRDKAIYLLQQLENNPMIESVCSIPLNCAIVCHLWHSFTEALPTTMTELYTKIIQNFIVRNLRKFDAYRIEGLTSFGSLPEGLVKSWWLLCKFAFHALIKNQIVFSSKDLDSFFPHEEKRICEKIQYFGLVQCTETALETERGESFNFVHLTFQEYLAALHLAQQPLNDQLQLLKTSFTEDLDTQQLLLVNSNLSIVWRFYFGICFNLQECSERSISLIIKHLSTMWDFRKSDDALPFWHYAFEAKNETVTNAIIRRALCSSGEHLEDEISDDAVIVKELDISGVENAHDSSVAIYIISKIKVCNAVDIDFDNCGLQDNQLKTLTNVLAEKQTKLQVKSLSLSQNRLTDKSVSDIFERAIAAFQLLKSLYLDNNMIGTDSIKSLAQALTKLPSNVLSDLYLSHNPLGVSGMVALEKAISCGSFVKLKTLSLEKCFTEDTKFNMTIVTTLLDAISISCPLFSCLDISHNDFGVSRSEARQLSKFAPNRDYTLSQCYDLDLDVDLSHNMLTDKNLNDLFQKASPSLLLLKELNLSNNRIEADGISSIATFLAISPANKLSNLDLSYNRLGQQGLSSLESAIRSGSLHKLCYLYLKGSLTDDADVNNVVFSDFIDAIAVHCPGIKNLDLSDNNFGMPETSVDAYLKVSSENDREKSSIKSLDLSDSHLTESNVQDLFQRASTALQSVQELDLSNNRLGADSITSIAAAIAKSPFNINAFPN